MKLPMIKYGIRISISRRLHKQLVIAPQYLSNSTLSDGGKQQHHANLRSQLPLDNIASRISSVNLTNFSPETNNATPDSPNASKKHRSLRPFIYGLIFFSVGSLAGNFISSIAIPPASPIPDSPEDKIMIKYLHERAANLPLVKLLSTDTRWSPVETYTGENKKNEDEKLNETEEIKETLRRRLTAGPLKGSRALGGYQKTFRNIETGEVIKILWLGPSISGWPGVAHGGVLATLLDETLGRCAMGFLEGSTGVTANLQVNYLKPILTNGFYVIRASVEEDEEILNEKKNFNDRQRKRKKWVTGTLENADGTICVTAKALFVVPKNYKLNKLNP